MDKKIMMYYPTAYPTTALPYYPTGVHGPNCVRLYTPSPLCNKRDLIVCFCGFLWALLALQSVIMLPVQLEAYMIAARV